MRSSLRPGQPLAPGLRITHDPPLNLKCTAAHLRLSQTVLTATPPKKSQAWTWHLSHVFCRMSSAAST